jgi:hypothetical protein
LVDNLCVFGVKAPFLKLKQVVLDTLFSYKGSKKQPNSVRNCHLTPPKNDLQGDDFG